MYESICIVFVLCTPSKANAYSNSLPATSSWYLLNASTQRKKAASHIEYQQMYKFNAARWRPWKGGEWNRGDNEPSQPNRSPESAIFSSRPSCQLVQFTHLFAYSPSVLTFTSRPSRRWRGMRKGTGARKERGHWGNRENALP